MIPMPQIHHAGQTPQRTTVGPQRGDVAFLLVTGAATGALIGWFLPALADLIRDRNWVPLRQLVVSLADLMDHGHAAAHLVLTAVLAAILAALALTLLDDTKVVVDDRAITVHRRSGVTRVARAQIAGIEVEPRSLGRSVVSLRDREDVDLVRVELDVPSARVRDALTVHRWSYTVVPRDD